MSCSIDQYVLKRTLTSETFSFSNTANETMIEDYVQQHLAGNHVFKRGKEGHRETLSCFDKTKPVSCLKRPGGHGPPKAGPSPNDPHYNNATMTYEFTSKVPGPSSFQRARQPVHEDAPGGACTSLAVGKREVKPITPPVSGAYKIRMNPPNTEFRRFYERGDLPIAIGKLLKHPLRQCAELTCSYRLDRAPGRWQQDSVEGGHREAGLPPLSAHLLRRPAGERGALPLPRSSGERNDKLQTAGQPPPAAVPDSWRFIRFSCWLRQQQPLEPLHACLLPVAAISPAPCAAPHAGAATMADYDAGRGRATCWSTAGARSFP